ncbi:SDR family NAD(P)-dependent oxidoreductase [Pseudoalteromonas sp. SR41-1]|uniref:SDR family NAD(P)-dependent oxidoreductase n=1 Tax=Pseudoalteromonas sp. SR41-1 TaxID=2760952 RepID=UPI001604734E|nr:SDR family oxidoreductase [Pseudoalteromonas sp. SR41-1]MBB1279847.1 SDR family oxidoreductase [Pseudoalteromonas sp. SR41-1]
MVSFSKKAFRFLRKAIKNISRFFCVFIDYYKYGGVTYAQISQINYGNTLAGRRVLITGGSSGIGFAIAQKAISEGAKVVITGRNMGKLEAAKLKISNDLLSIIQWDVSEISLIHSKLKDVSKLLGGKPNVLVNNAGILLDQNFFTTTEDIWDKTYQVNSKSIYFLSQAIANDLIKCREKGKIINISSTSGFYGTAIPYGMTKWDVAGLTEGLGKKLAPHGIIVNGIAPGRTATSMLNKDSNDNIYDSLTSAKRYVMPEEIAELAIFLMSGSTNFIVGQTIVCDGGYILKVH